MDQKHYELYCKLGANIAYYRRDRGYTQEQLAELLDMDRTSISKLELAVAGALLDTIFSIAQVLRVPLPQLFTFRG